MEQLPQRESVPQVGVFHTPRLRNIRLLAPQVPTLAERPFAENP